ncbi:M48 family metalloprotease [Brunnivagina elsteri]|uniref:Peptidase M48 n=1 Tax=Brunnivagina elsteri CCALA 953 TaxID=987040 RepID=A0A2A2TDQ1_9CYAN|nr:M48 family metalloprotease [Calothrix elsteri]PAX51843.1 peptidase M48 [Calothrix elsteri CCALA 953]
MLNITQKCICVFSSCLLTFPSAISIATEPVSNTEPAKTSTFERAQAELPADLYTLYRIIDRIARGNNYDGRPWKVVITSSYNPNAFASENNSIAIYNGFLEQLGGDTSALACSVSREMAHHINRHTVISEVQKAEAIAKIRTATEKEILGNEGSQRNRGIINTVGGIVAETFLPGWAGNLIGGIFGNNKRDRMEKAERKVNTLVEKRTKELEQNLFAQYQQQQLKADELGYMASVRAGFEPEGCLRAIETLDRISNSPENSANTPIVKRMEAIIALLVKYPPQTLVPEGESRISKSQPLNYDISQDKASLRINSRHGGSAARDIDRLFGK